MKLWWKVVIALCLFTQVSSFALDDSPFSEQQLSLATGQATTICTSMLSNMDVVLAKSYVFDSTIVKGALGEAVAGRHYLSAYLAKKWQLGQHFTTCRFQWPRSCVCEVRSKDGDA